MTLWRAPIRSEAPLSGVWRALSRYNYGCDLLFDPARGWVLAVDRLERHRGEWVKHRIGEWVERDGDEVDLLVRVLPVLPGIGVRLALMGLVL